MLPLASDLLETLGKVLDRLDLFQAAFWATAPGTPPHAEAKTKLLNELGRFQELFTLTASRKFREMPDDDRAVFQESISLAKARYMDHLSKIFLHEMDVIGAKAAKILETGGSERKEQGVRLQTRLQTIMTAFASTLSEQTASEALLRCLEVVKQQVDALVD